MEVGPPTKNKKETSNEDISGQGDPEQELEELPNKINDDSCSNCDASSEFPIIYMPQEISDQIIYHANLHQRETGGVVIGYRWNDPHSNQLKFLIHYVSDEGREINVSSGHFNGDMEYFSQKVEEWQTSQDAEFLGIWHSHPEGVNYLSGGDFHSVQRVFEYNPDLPIFLAPLVVYTPDNDREIIFFFINCLQRHFTRIPPETNVIFTTDDEFAYLRDEALAGRNQ